VTPAEQGAILFFEVELRDLGPFFLKVDFEIIKCVLRPPANILHLTSSKFSSSLGGKVHSGSGSNILHNQGLKFDKDFENIENTYRIK